MGGSGKPTGVMLGTMSGLDENSVRLKQTITPPGELTFEVSRYLYINGELVETSYYDFIAERMELYLDSEDFKGRFVIDREPQRRGDGEKEVKSITAHSIESELQDKILKGFQINTGLDASQENLVEGDIFGRTVDPSDMETPRYNYNINPYTELPVDYIRVCHNARRDIAKMFKNLDEGKISINDIEYEISVDPETGEVTSPTEGLVEAVYQTLLSYPRLSDNVRWGIDDREESDTKGQPTAVTESYLRVNTDDDNRLTEGSSVAIPPRNFRMVLQGDGYHIIDDTSSTYSIQTLQDGVDAVLSYYDEFGTQLSMLDLALQKVGASGWSIGDVPDDIAEKYFTFNIDSQDIYSFFTQACARAMKVLFTFDSLNKKVNIVDISGSDEVHDTGVFIGLKNLMNTVEVNTASDDGVKTKFKPTGSNGLGIELVNFGDQYITNLDYYMSKVNGDGEYQYVNKPLHDKYFAWRAYRESEEFTVHGVPSYNLSLYDKTVEVPAEGEDITYPSRRAAYTELSKLYNQAIVDYDNLNDLLPSDGCSIDYTTFTFEELCNAWTAYKNALEALLALYADDYNVARYDEQFADNHKAYKPDGTLATPITETMYWHDFASYIYTIIPNVENALKMYVLTDKMGLFIEQSRDQNGMWKEAPGGNPIYNENPEIVTENTTETYKYDVSLYGLSELTALRKSYIEAANVLYKDGFVTEFYTDEDHKLDPDVVPGTAKTYNTADEAGWNRLTEITTDRYGNPLVDKDNNPINAQALFTAMRNFADSMNLYLDYVSPEVRDNSLTKAETVGVIPLFSAAIEECEKSLKKIQDAQTTLWELRDEITRSVTFENWVGTPELGRFTDNDLAIINTLITEADYANENILITNLDNIVSQINAEEELYIDANKKLFEKSRPQYSFTVTMDNLMAIPEFVVLKPSIALLNFVYVVIGLYNNETVRVRLMSIEGNPMIPNEELTLSFSNMMYTYDGLSDLIHLLGDASAGGGTATSSASGTSDSGGGGTYGAVDAEIQLSNNMLTALLKNRDYPTSLSTQISENTRTIYQKLSVGDIVIDGECVSNIIKSKNYMTTGGLLDNTSGSVINLKDGSFSFGGGKLKFDNDTGTLDIESTMSAGYIKSANYNGTYHQETGVYDIDNTVGTLINLNSGPFNFGGGALKYNGINLTVNVNGGQIKGSNLTLNLDNGNVTFGRINSINGNGTFSFANNKLRYINGELYINGNITATNVISGASVLFTNTLAFKSGYTGTTFDILKVQEKQSYDDGDTVQLGTSSAYLTITGGQSMLSVFNTGLSVQGLYSTGISCSGTVSGSTISGTNFSCSNKISGTYLDIDSFVHLEQVWTQPISNGRDVKIIDSGLLGTPASTKRLKKNITTNLTLSERNPLNLYKLPVVQFQWKTEEKNPTGKSSYNLGLIAEDVAELIPEGAYYDDEGLPSGWDSRILLVSAIKCIQDLNERVKVLEK